MDEIATNGYDFLKYTASTGLAHLFQAMQNEGADGTGIVKLLAITANIGGKKIPDVLIQYSVAVQINLFGGYPTTADVAPCALFCGIFGLLALIHLLIFSLNFSRGHYFWLSLAWFIYCLMRVVGFALRIVWGKDLTKLKVALTSEFFLLVPSILLVSLDLILAQRLFTWRHPVGGSRRLFWSIMIGMYAGVVVIVGISTLASFVPYIDFLSKKAFDLWKDVVKATSIPAILYSLTSIILIGLSYFFPPTAKDENLYTYQPWWIESFSLFYFVQPGAAQQAEETFMKRNHNHRHAIRVIAATHHHYNVVEGLSNERGDLKHNFSLMLIFVTAILIFVGNVGRAVVVFQAKSAYDSSAICKPVAMYICWGAFEVIINLLYIFGRVDLRFYRPDVLPKRVRAIITAEQSYYPSEAEDEDGDEMDDSENLKLYMTTSDRSSGHRAPNSPPYPHSDFGHDTYRKSRISEDDDNVSDFHF